MKRGRRSSASLTNGAIDDKPTSDAADLPGAHNDIDATLTESLTGRAIATPTSRPYGCAVKHVSTNQ